MSKAKTQKSKAPVKKKAAKKAASKTNEEKATINKQEQFAYSYIMHMGNGTSAYTEVYGVEGNKASVAASQLLRNPKVQKIIKEYTDARKKAFKEFVEQQDFYLTAVIQRLLKELNKEDLTVNELEKLCVLVARFSGMEMSEGVITAKVQAKESSAARARALLPGVPGSGQQPGASSGGNIDNSRKSIFLLSPPPIPPGGVPTPALMAQWAEMLGEAGFRPGVEQKEEIVQNVDNAQPASHPAPVTK